MFPASGHAQRGTRGGASDGLAVLPCACVRGKTGPMTASDASVIVHRVKHLLSLVNLHGRHRDRSCRAIRPSKWNSPARGPTKPPRWSDSVEVATRVGRSVEAQAQPVER